MDTDNETAPRRGAAQWKDSDAAYGDHALARGVPLEEARRRITAALATQGFGILTEIDVKETLRKKLGEEVPGYLILGACNPTLAKRALEIDPSIGLLLPCNVSLWETDVGTRISLARPEAMFTLVGDPRIASIAEEATLRLRAALAAVRTPPT